MIGFWVFFNSYDLNVTLIVILIDFFFWIFIMNVDESDMKMMKKFGEEEEEIRKILIVAGSA